MAATLVSLLSGYMYYKYTTEMLKDVFTENLRERQTNHSTILNGTFREWEEKVITSMEAVGTLLESESLLEANAPHQIDTVIENSMKALFSTGISQLGLYDPAGQLISKAGEDTGTTDPTELITAVARDRAPHSELKCSAMGECTHYVAIPILTADHKTRAILRSAESFKEVATSFTGITGERIELMNLKRALNRTLIDPLAGKEIRIPILLKTDIPGFPADKWALVTTLDTSATRHRLTEVTQRSAILAFSMCALLLMFMTPAITMSLRRLKDTIASFEPLASGEAAESEPPCNNRLWHDEIDKLNNVLLDTRKRISNLTMGLRDSHETLTEQLAFKEDLFRALEIPLFAVRLDGSLTGANCAFDQFFGVRTADLKGTKLQECDSNGALQQFVTTLKEQGAWLKKVSKHEVRYTGAGGVEHWCMVTGAQHSGDGHTLRGYIYTIVDLTQLRVQEQRLAWLGHHLPGALYQWMVQGEEGEITYLSEGFERLTGYQVSACLGALDRVVSIIHVDDRLRFSQSVRTHVESKTNWEFTGRIIRADEQERWIRAESSIQQRPDGRQVWTGIILDITHEHEATIQEQLAKAKMEEREFLLRSINHEFRTPLNALVAYASLLTKRGDDPRTLKECIYRIELSARDLLQQSEAMLSWQREQYEHTITTRTRTVDIERFIREIAAVFDYQVANNGNVLNLLVNPAMEKRVVLHDLALAQAVKNAISNACKYTKNGSITVHVSVNLAQELDITVVDDGKGMDETQLNGMFTYFRGDPKCVDVRNPSNGLGMGLSRQVLREIGGDILVQSSKQSGTIVRITAPFWVEGETASKELTTPVPVRPLGLNRVLVVDDEPLCLDVLATHVRLTGAEVDTASTGLRALQKLRQKHYDAIIIDHNMPGQLGADTITQIQQEQPEEKMVFILLTGDTEAPVPANSFRVLKPVHPDNLLTILFAAADKLEPSMAVIAPVAKVTTTSLAVVFDYAKITQHVHTPSQSLSRARRALKRYKNKVDAVAPTLGGSEDQAKLRKAAHFLSSGGPAIYGMARLAQAAERILETKNIADPSVYSKLRADLVEVIALTTVEVNLAIEKLARETVSRGLIH